MTLLVILAALVAGGLWAGAHQTSIVAGPLTVYVLAFALGLAAAAVAALLSRQRRNLAAAGVLVLSLLGSHAAWTTADPVLAQAVVWIATASYFVLAGRERWELAIGAACLSGLAVAVLTATGAIPAPADRPGAFLAWNFADLSSLVGHACSVLLGLGSGDWGRRVRSAAVLHWRSAPVR